jgi:circadian clock protein KaiB
MKKPAKVPKPKAGGRRRSPRPKREASKPAIVAPGARYHFQLYITGTGPRSAQAVANLRDLCEEHLGGAYDLEVIDLYQEPGRAATGQIIASPTLVKKLPRPLMRMVGSLADREQLLIKLNLAVHPVPPAAAPTRLPS